MLITDQVATAPCTDPTQVRFLTFEAKQPANAGDRANTVKCQQICSARAAAISWARIPLLPSLGLTAPGFMLLPAPQAKTDFLCKANRNWKSAMSLMLIGLAACINYFA